MFAQQGSSGYARGGVFYPAPAKAPGQLNTIGGKPVATLGDPSQLPGWRGAVNPNVPEGYFGTKQQPAQQGWKPQQTYSPALGAGQGGVPAAQPTIGTSISPQPVFSQPFMQQATNMAAAQGVPARADMQTGFFRPGLSMTSGVAQTGMDAQYGAQAAQGANNAASLGQLMAWANANNNLAGQQARDQEAIGWGNLYGQGLQDQWQLQNTQQGNILGLLQRLMGWM